MVEQSVGMLSFPLFLEGRISIRSSNQGKQHYAAYLQICLGTAVPHDMVNAQSCLLLPKTVKKQEAKLVQYVL